MEAVAHERNDRLILEEFLNTPVVKDVLSGTLRNIDSGRGTILVEKLMWKDSETMLALLSSLPHVINYTVNVIAAFGEQAREKFSPPLLKEFLGSVMSEVDTERIKECAVVYASLAKDLWDASPEVKEKLRASFQTLMDSMPELKAIALDMALREGPPLIGRGITAGARAVNSLNERDPQAVSRFVRGVFENVDPDEFRNATHVIAEAFLDQKPPLISWTWQLIVRRFRRKRNR
jgi:hypothetical protein